MQTEVETLEAEMNKTTSRPCIFGAEIKDVCPVFKSLKEKPEATKYIKESSELLDVFRKGLETVTSHFAQLHYFCAICPFLAKFKETKKDDV